jgi:hypothetical protein
MSLRKRYGDANANTLCPGPLKDCPAISCTIVHLLSHRLRLGLWEQFATFKVTLAGLRQVGAATTMCRPSASHNTRFAHNAPQPPPPLEVVNRANPAWVVES